MSRDDRTLRPDATLALLGQGYDFISRRCARAGSDVTETRLLGERTICMQGRHAAELLYDRERFIRQGAFPPRVLRTLLGRGGVQTLDGATHRHRKQMMLSLLSGPSIGPLVELVVERWREHLVEWEAGGEIHLSDETARILCSAVCEWAGVPLPAGDVGRRTSDLCAMIDAPAAVGPRHWRGLVARRRSERWGAGLVDEVRSGRLRAPRDRALHVVSWHRDHDGRLLDRRVAAVELLNVLRPTVAVNRFIVFTALALHQHPEVGEQVRSGGDEVLERVVQEVRRTTPFFPAVAARVRSSFEDRGVRFPKGRRVLLDLYGTNRDGRIWDDPEQFRPDRFVGRPIGPFDLVPQGGGDHAANHRCAGEDATIAIMMAALRILATEMAYTVPDQDLSVSLRRMPTLPRSGMRLTDVRRRSAAAPAG